MVVEFKIGFMGSASVEAAQWATEKSRAAQHICVPFAGSCKDIAAMAREDTLIESWDTQLISRAVIEGVFTAKSIETVVDKPRYTKGYMYESRAIRDIDAASAGFIDWVGANGTLADKVAIFSATVRSSLMGRLTHWTGANLDMLWTKFQKQRIYIERFTNMPGKFIHHEGSVYDELPKGPYDLVQIDPPKVVTGGADIYSTNYSGLNKALGGKCELPRWSWRDVLGYMRPLYNIDTKRILMMYVSDVKPSIDEVRRLIGNHGTIEEDVRFMHRSRYDYGIVLNKEQAHD